MGILGEVICGAKNIEMTTILLPSVQSLYIELRFNETTLSSWTGFIANSPSWPVLLTNRHNVTGRNNTTGELLNSLWWVPNKIIILQNKAWSLGQWVVKNEQLFKNDIPRWIEHPTLWPQADFVALPLTDTEGVDLYPYHLWINERQIKVAPSENISVVGFPFGLTGGWALAIWVTGFMATELDINQFNLPIFLIDCRARKGQSGSAVIAHRNWWTVAMEDWSSGIFWGPITRFLGIYSGRVNEESDLGIVWKASAIKELVDSIT